MEFIHELLANAAATDQLKYRYYWLTTGVGLVAGALACGVIFVEFQLLTAQNDAIAGVVLFCSIPLIIYFSAVFVAAGFALVMVCLKQFTPKDAWFYAWRSRYPRHWYRVKEQKA